MIKFIFLICLFFCNACWAKIPHLSKYERSWAILHPFSAMRVNKITKKCYAIYHQAEVKTQLDSYASGGKLDAFRHSFFMAAYAQKIKIKKLRKLGEAHEKGNYRQFLKSQKEYGDRSDSLACVMDLRNNELGFSLGKANKNMNLGELKNLAISEIKKGNAFIFKRNSFGNYVDCDNHEIDMNAFLKSWFVPKCLISSE